MNNISYHGWIYLQKEPGFNPRFIVHVTPKDASVSMRYDMGFGDPGAVASVNFFENEEVAVLTSDGIKSTYKGLGLGHVMLENTPLGIRVFTESRTDRTKS